jgi:serine/threonine protein kinase
MADGESPESETESVPPTRTSGPGSLAITPLMTGTSAPVDVLTGRLLGEYRLLERIGRGGMGQVFRALHLRLDKLVALKVLPSDRFGDPQAVARFEREMRAVGRLDHPNIVLARDAGEVDGIHFLVMELLDGVDLAALVRKSGPLDVAIACEMIRQAASGLQHAHERGLVHRDIKPSNVMLTTSGIVKLLDLGLALIRDPSSPQVATMDGAMMGTTDYMAPEQWSDSHRVDIRADLYSLGCTLYVLLTGEPPFANATHPTTVAKMTAHLNEPPPSIRSRRGEVPEELVLILDRLLAKNPADRFATPGELAVALAPLASSEGLRRLLDPNRVESEPESAPVPPPSTGPVDDVQFTVYRPRVLAPSRWHPMLVFAHLSAKPDDAPKETLEPIEEVRKQAETVLGPQLAAEYQSSTQDSTRDVPREGLLTLVPMAPGIEFNPPQRSFRWEEWVHREEFRLRAREDLDGKTVKGRVSAYLGTILIAEVALRFRVDSREEPSVASPMEPIAGRMFRRIFASFAQDDRPVAAQFERFARAMGDEYLSRCTSLRAGDAWDDRLRELIDKADVFQLFWSKNALRSPLVEREWRHALTLNRPSFIRPVYWEEPLPTDPERGLPPDVLSRLYFQRLDGIAPTPPEPPRAMGVRPSPGEATATDSVGEVGAIPDDPGATRMIVTEKDIFEDTNFDLEIVALDDDDNRAVQRDRSSDFDLEESDSDSEVYAFDADVDEDAPTAMKGPSDRREIPGDASARPVANAADDLSQIALGSTVAGRYLVVEQLVSWGAMPGTSWFVEARSPLGCRGLLKVYPAGQLNDHDLGLIRRQAEDLRSVGGRSVERILDIGLDIRGNVYVVTELAQGRTLDQLDRTRSPAGAVRLALRLGEALAEIHEAGLIHGDLKPSNVVVGDEGQVTLRDLVFEGRPAKPSADLALTRTQEPSSFGTPAYMAPELIREGSKNARTDLYALGVIFYKLIEGKNPFEGRTPLEILRQVLVEPVPPLSSDDIPPEVERLILQCLEKDPARRPESARQFVEALRVWVESVTPGPSPRPTRTPGSSGPLTMAPASAADPASRPAKDWPMTLVAIVFCAIVGLVAWLMFRR